jgi:DNA-binding NtrC family response regulator
MSTAILLVEDKEPVRQMLRRALEADGHAVLEAADEVQACEVLQHSRPALVLTDLKLPRGDGFGILRVARHCDPAMPVILLTAHGNLPDAVRAMREGALDFLAKPVDPEHLRMIVLRALEGRRMATENQLLREELARTRGVPRIIGDHASIKQALGALTRAAAVDATVLLAGGSGAGKELFARALHALSDRRDGPFVAINCAAIPGTLLESELFGHEKGAFTGALARKPGKFEIAHQGTLFLDEIGELPLALQPKLLRALQERTFERLGGNAPVQVDVRVVAATNRDLHAAVAQRQFRDDLFFRLAVLLVNIPPLRERASDVPLIARFMLERAAAAQKKALPAFAPAALAALIAYPWPGNVRELENCIERAVILCDSVSIQPRHLRLLPLPEPSRPPADVNPWDLVDLSGTLDEAARRAVKEVERRKIAQALRDTDGDTLKAAEMLGMPSRLLTRKIRAYAINVESRAF